MESKRTKAWLVIGVEYSPTERLLYPESFRFEDVFGDEEKARKECELRNRKEYDRYMMETYFPENQDPEFENVGPSYEEFIENGELSYMKWEFHELNFHP